MPSDRVSEVRHYLANAVLPTAQSEMFDDLLRKYDHLKRENERLVAENEKLKKRKKVRP